MIMLVSLSNDYITSEKRVNMINSIIDFVMCIIIPHKKMLCILACLIYEQFTELIRKEVGLFIFSTFRNSYHPILFLGP